jgi:hypothetical protein
MWYHNGKLFGHKKEEKFFDNMDEPGGHHKPGTENTA